ncbi:hypothetical protein ACNOYE_05890 [Nannocystaceae bacterium ST9]
MTRLLLAGLLLGPPASEPASAPEYDEAIVIEPAPVVAEAPPPTSVEIEAEPLALPEGPTTIGLPPLPPPPPPPDGSGRLVGGSLALGLGVAAFVTVSQEAQRVGGNTTYVAATFVPLGLASLGIGTYLLVKGGQARANFRHWKQYTGYEVPPQGAGLLVGGTMITAIGGVVLIAGASRSARGEQDTLTTALLSFGGAGLVAGGIQLALGFVRRERHRRWRHNSLFVLGPPTIAPLAPIGARARVDGLALGLSGRF